MISHRVTTVECFEILRRNILFTAGNGSSWIMFSLFHYIFGRTYAYVCMCESVSVYEREHVKVLVNFSFLTTHQLNELPLLSVHLVKHIVVQVKVIQN